MMLILPNILGLNGGWFAQPIADVISFVLTSVLLVREVKTKIYLYKNKKGVLLWLKLKKKELQI